MTALKRAPSEALATPFLPHEDRAAQPLGDLEQDHVFTRGRRRLSLHGLRRGSRWTPAFLSENLIPRLMAHAVRFSVLAIGLRHFLDCEIDASLPQGSADLFGQQAVRCQV